MYIGLVCTLSILIVSVEQVLVSVLKTEAVDSLICTVTAVAT